MNYNTTGNNSWLFQKAYYNGFVWNNNKLEPYAPDFFRQRLGWIKSVHLSNVMNEKSDTHIKLKTTYPGLVTGIGVTHQSKSKGELMLGFEFDYTTGMPVIRGHSLKGALRSAFPQKQNRDVKHKPEKAYQIYCWLNRLTFTGEGLMEFQNTQGLYETVVSYENEIFDGKINGRLISNYKQDVFFDSYISKASLFPSTRNQYLGDDSITPHVKRGIPYEQAMLTDPIPLPFLKILPCIEIEFRFKLHENGLLSIENKKNLFKEILMNQGIGAKTNLGYGQFEASPPV
ncbi:MAG: type III-B CRISPR module RAMP protein Cmr6 [Mariniphaga sp.]